MKKYIIICGRCEYRQPKELTEPLMWVYINTAKCWECGGAGFDSIRTQ